MNTDLFLNELEIEEQIKNLCSIHYSYDELYSYYLKYKQDCKEIDLPLNYIFKYFNKHVEYSQIDGSYIFLGLTEDKKYILFGRFYRPKEFMWSKYQIRVKLNKFRNTKYEITKEPTYNGR